MAQVGASSDARFGASGCGAHELIKILFESIIWFGGIHGPQSNKFIGFRWAFDSQTLVLRACLARKREYVVNGVVGLMGLALSSIKIV